MWLWLWSPQRVVDDLKASLLPWAGMHSFICLFKLSAWMSIAYAYCNQPAYAVRDEWHGRCYEAISLDSPETKDLGPCQAYVVSSGHSRVIRGVELRSGLHVFGWSDASSDIFMVDGKPGRYVVQSGKLPYRLYRYGFCISSQGSGSMTCFVPY